jgi:hypothetical protein
VFEEVRCFEVEGALVKGGYLRLVLEPKKIDGDK